MFQFGVSFEFHIAGKSYTAGIGWGMQNEGKGFRIPVFNMYSMTVAGAKRYGVILLGLFVTLTALDIAAAAAEVQRQAKSR